MLSSVISLEKAASHLARVGRNQASQYLSINHTYLSAALRQFHPLLREMDLPQAAADYIMKQHI